MYYTLYYYIWHNVVCHTGSDSLCCLMRFPKTVWNPTFWKLKLAQLMPIQKMAQSAAFPKLQTLLTFHQVHRDALKSEVKYLLFMSARLQTPCNCFNVHHSLLDWHLPRDSGNLLDVEAGDWRDWSWWVSFFSIIIYVHTIHENHSTKTRSTRSFRERHCFFKRNFATTKVNDIWAIHSSTFFLSFLGWVTTLEGGSSCEFQLGWIAKLLWQPMGLGHLRGYRTGSRLTRSFWWSASWRDFHGEVGVFFPWVPTIRLTLPAKWTSNTSLKSGCCKKNACLDNMLHWQDSAGCCQKLHCTVQGDVSSAQISFMLNMHGEFFFGHSPYIISVAPCFGGSFVRYHPFLVWCVHQNKTDPPSWPKTKKNKPKTTSSIGFLLVLIRSDLWKISREPLTTHRFYSTWFKVDDQHRFHHLQRISLQLYASFVLHLSGKSLCHQDGRDGVYQGGGTFPIGRNRDAERCSNSEGF